MPRPSLILEVPVAADGAWYRTKLVADTTGRPYATQYACAAAIKADRDAARAAREAEQHERAMQLLARQDADRRRG